MKPLSYTSRDLNRNPARVFEAVKTYGSVDICTRAGDTYVISLKKKHSAKEEKMEPDFDSHWQKIPQLGNLPAINSELEGLDQIIAGEA